MGEMGVWATRAVNHLLAAGMVVRYRSQWGNTVYLGWPGRKGVLRVSDHQGRSGRDDGIYARVTIRDEHAPPRGIESLTDRCAMALGRYLMKTAGEDVVEFPFHGSGPHEED